MDKLINYGSDDEYEESPKREKLEYQERRTQSLSSTSKANDVNYDDVSMDLSEDSDGSGKADYSRPKNNDTKDAKHYPDREQRDRRKDRRDSPKSSSSRYNRSKDDERSDRFDRERDRYDDNKRDSRYSREREDSGRHNRDRDDDRHRRDRDEGRERNRYRDRRERRSRSRSAGRRRRSNSRERGAGVGGGGKFGGGYSRRFEKASNKMAHLEKMGIEIKAPEGPPLEMKKDEQNSSAGGDKNFFLPGVTGRLREQMERRKLLWQKKEPEKAAVAQQPVSAAPAGPSKTGKVWEATIFAQDQDGKQASKFKRLMGIRESSGDSAKSVPDIVKKQEELFSTMEQQYEVARTATHTMRGVGLGFGSYQR